MSLKLGPILRLKDTQGERLSFSILAVFEGKVNPLKIVIARKSETLAGRELKKAFAAKIITYSFEIKQTAKEQVICYTLDGEDYSFVVPGSEAPVRIAFGSCNGFHSLKDLKKVDEPLERWSHLKDEHKKSPFHLLILGGDQVYADPMWEQVPTLEDWNDTWIGKWKKAFTKKMKTEVEKFYQNLYLKRWSQGDMRKVMASIPSVMIWDDHDIFDGWGSYDKKRQRSPVYKGIFKQANEAFALFQQHQKPDDSSPANITKNGWTSGFVLGQLGVLLLDTRTERSEDRILGMNSWNQIFRWIDKLPNIKHLFVIAPIPVVYPSFDFLETALNALPGHQDIEDDIRDHWRSRPHRDERLRLIHRLLKFANRSGPGKKRCRVTILSGDVHVAAMGVIESKHDGQTQINTNVINQLISSAIVNAPPPGAVLFFLNRLGGGEETVTRGITAKMLPFAGTETKFLPKRNYLSLTLDKDSRIWAEWHVEGDKYPYTKVIHPPQLS